MRQAFDGAEGMVFPTGNANNCLCCDGYNDGREYNGPLEGFRLSSTARYTADFDVSAEYVTASAPADDSDTLLLVRSAADSYEVLAPAS